MPDTRALFAALVGRLAGRARRDLLIHRSVTGLFFGLLPGVVVSLLSGSVALPIPAFPFVAGTAAAGCAAGLVSALLHGVDRRRLLIRADKRLGSRELASTAFELAESADPGIFADAVLEDAAQLLMLTPPRTILGRLRLPLAPFAVLAALVAAAGLLFPFDLHGLFPRRAASDPELAQIGEDLRNRGLRLAEDARTHDLGRSLELSRELAQLGSDLAANRIQPEDALDRMSELESGLAEEYQLRILEAQGPAGKAGSGQGSGGQPGGGQQGSGQRAGQGQGLDGRAEEGTSSSPEPGADKSLEDLGGTGSALGDALDRLRQAQRRLSGRGSGDGQGDGAQAQSPSRPRRQRESSGAQPGAPGLPSGQGGPDQRGQRGRDQGSESGGAGEGAENPGQSGQSGGSGVGTLPAPLKRGAPSEIIDNPRGPGLQAQGNAPEGDSTRLLARALPQWTGSRLPEEAILNRYSRQAESALARDEIPLKLKEYVKQYFTVIGISK